MALTTLGYYQSFGADVATAPRTAGGNFVIPAASGGAPGFLTLYVARPLAVPARYTPIGAAPYSNYQDTQYVNVSFGSPAGCGTGYAWLFDAWDRTLDLISAADSIVGSFTLTTRGLTAAGAEFGDPPAATRATATVSRSISH